MILHFYLCMHKSYQLLKSKPGHSVKSNELLTISYYFLQEVVGYNTKRDKSNIKLELALLPSKYKDCRVKSNCCLIWSQHNASYRRNSYGIIEPNVLQSRGTLYTRFESMMTKLK